MKTPLAIYNLWHQGVKTLVSVGGVSFALLLVFMQLGFKGAVSTTATNVLDNLEFDILLRSHEYMHLYEAGRIERRWLDAARGADNVENVVPFWITIQNWKTIPNKYQVPPLSDGDGIGLMRRSWLWWRGIEEYRAQYQPIAVMAFRPSDDVFRLEKIKDQQSLLRNSSKLLIDDGSHDDYGPWNGVYFTKDDLRRNADIYQREFEIAGLYELGTGLAANGAVVMGEKGFGRIWPGLPTSHFTSLALITTEDKSPDAVQRAVNSIRERTLGSKTEEESGGIVGSITRWFGILPELKANGAVEVLTKQQAKEREVYRWLWQTPIGLIFQMGVVLALIVGAAIVYMILSTDVANRLPEYATLLAMGYSRMYLAGIVMTQAILLCILGFVCAWGIAEVLYRITYWLSNLPLEMNPTRVVTVLVLGLVMCCVSGLFALRKLWKAEPASLF